jgi:DNA-binding transcriptional regulator GbsR (MarR family)
MNANSVSLKSIEQITGIDKSNLSAYVKGLRPMSQPVKAMFFFMFSSSKF